MMPAPARVVSIQLGPVAPLGPNAVPSGYVKRPVTGAAQIGPLGLIGDAQADLRVHGGPEKAVYGYGEPAYARWRAGFPEHATRLVPGALGENLTLADWTEADVCIGDLVSIGSAKLRVTQSRQPCFKLALAFEDSRMPVAMHRLGLCGWYYSVAATGTIAPGDFAEVIERPNPTWPVTRLFALVGRKSGVAGDMRELLTLSGLAARWRHTARQSLGQGDLL